MRRRLAVLAAVPLLALTLGAGSASAAPAHQASIVLGSDVRDLCWAPNAPNTDLTWGSGSPRPALNFSNDCNNGNYGAIDVVVGPCEPAPYQGYCQFSEVSYNSVLGYWSTTGNCVGYSYSLNRLVEQGCADVTYQFWAGTGSTPDLIWSQWLQLNYPHVCPIYGGYTQQVITDDSGTGPAYLSCPQGAGGQSYLGTQKWNLYTPVPSV